MGFCQQVRWCYLIVLRFRVALSSKELLQMPRPGAGFVSVTRNNVRLSDGTLVFGDPRHAEALFAIKEATRLCKPLLVVEWNRMEPVPNHCLFRQWVISHRIRTLHVAGQTEDWRNSGLFETAKAYFLAAFTDPTDQDRSSTEDHSHLSNSTTSGASADFSQVWLSPQAFAQMGSEIWRHFTVYETKTGKNLLPHLKTYFRMRQRRAKCSSHGDADHQELVWIAFGSM